MCLFVEQLALASVRHQIMSWMEGGGREVAVTLAQAALARGVHQKSWEKCVLDKIRLEINIIYYFYFPLFYWLVLFIGRRNECTFQASVLQSAWCLTSRGKEERGSLPEGNSSADLQASLFYLALSPGQAQKVQILKDVNHENSWVQQPHPPKRVLGECISQGSLFSEHTYLYIYNIHVCKPHVQGGLGTENLHQKWEGDLGHEETLLRSDALACSFQSVL